MYQQINSEKVLNIVSKFEALFAELKVELASTTAEETVIDHNGLKLRKVDREAKKGDYVRLVGNTSSLYTNGKIYGPVLRINGEICLENDEGLTPILYRANFNRTRETVEVFEVISAEKFEVEFTANQKRAALIEKAKEFVKEKSNRNYPMRDGYSGVWLVSNHRKPRHKLEFIVNSKERTVVALIKDTTFGKVVARGIAKCAPGDVFNEWIGKAIALARVLVIDVPQEFLEAVQPDGFAVGQIVGSDNSLWRSFSIKKIEDYYGSKRLWDINSYAYSESSIIIDDTNAEYVGGEINE